MATPHAPVIATPGFATMVTAMPPLELRSGAATVGHYASGAVQLLFLGLLVPAGILVAGLPIVLVVRAILAAASRF